MVGPNFRTRLCSVTAMALLLGCSDGSTERTRRNAPGENGPSGGLGAVAGNANAAGMPGGHPRLGRA
jgi:hypothetical protein